MESPGVGLNKRRRAFRDMESWGSAVSLADKLEQEAILQDFLQSSVSDILTDEETEKQDIHATITDIENCISPDYHLRKTLSVTDFSAQSWCELQLHFSRTIKRRIETPAMSRGTIRHAQLEHQLHEYIPIQVDTQEDTYALRFIDTITKLSGLRLGLFIDPTSGLQCCREIYIFGAIHGLWVVGYIDELQLQLQLETQLCGKEEMQSSVEMAIVDTKTRMRNCMPSIAQKRTSRLQLSVYRYLLVRMRELGAKGREEEGKEFLQEFFSFKGLDGRALISDTVLDASQLPLGCCTLLDVGMLMLKCIADSPGIVSVLQIRYEHQESRSEIGVDCFQYVEQPFLIDMHWFGEYWKGKRGAVAVQYAEKWKCNICQYKADCKGSPLLPISID